MWNKIKNVWIALIGEIKGNAVKQVAVKIILAVITIIFVSFTYFNDKILYPPFYGNITSVTYNINTGIQDLGKSFNITEEGVFYYYEGILQVTFEGRGKIESAYFLYSDSDDDNDITSGNVYTADVKRRHFNQFIIEHRINIRTKDRERYKHIYLVVIDKKTKEKSVYCLALKMNSMKFSSALQVGPQEEVEENIETEFQYESCSKEEIQKLEKNIKGSYISMNKKNILQVIEKIEFMNLE